VEELNKLERDFVAVLDWQLNIQDCVFDSYFEELVAHGNICSMCQEDRAAKAMAEAPTISQTSSTISHTHSSSNTCSNRSITRSYSRTLSSSFAPTPTAVDPSLKEQHMQRRPEHRVTIHGAWRKRLFVDEDKENNSSTLNTTHLSTDTETSEGLTDITIADTQRESCTDRPRKVCARIPFPLLLFYIFLSASSPVFSSNTSTCTHGRISPHFAAEWRPLDLDAAGRRPHHQHH
jgi:hypothetical protein